jgi:soluble lytic murein transglycosylase-like protein
MDIKRGDLAVNAVLWLLGWAGLMLANFASADIYTYIDESGTPSFSNVPTDTRYVLTMRTEVVLPVAKSKVKPSYFNPAWQNAYAPEIKRAALAYQLDPALLHAVIATESAYDARALSAKGAIGLMQLMPATAKRYGAVNPYNPNQNIWAGAQYLSMLMRLFGNNLQLALAAYNAGEANVVKYGGNIPPFAETTAYVPKVIALYQQYQIHAR